MSSAGDKERLSGVIETVSFLRKGPEEVYLVACNYTPVPRYDYRVGGAAGGVLEGSD